MAADVGGGGREKEEASIGYFLWIRPTLEEDVTLIKSAKVFFAAS
jgi:hypothetical protein